MIRAGCAPRSGKQCGVPPRATKHEANPACRALSRRSSPRRDTRRLALQHVHDLVLAGVRWNGGPSRGAMTFSNTVSAAVRLLPARLDVSVHRRVPRIVRPSPGPTTNGEAHHTPGSHIAWVPRIGRGGILGGQRRSDASACENLLPLSRSSAPPTPRSRPPLIRRTHLSWRSDTRTCAPQGSSSSAAISASSLLGAETPGRGYSESGVLGARPAWAREQNAAFAYFRCEGSRRNIRMRDSTTRASVLAPRNECRRFALQFGH
jgi:hypothetical protein